jgi:hypothetical protein
MQYQGTRIANASFPSRKQVHATKPAGGGSDLYHVVAGIPLKRKGIPGKKKPAAKSGRFIQICVNFNQFPFLPLTARFFGVKPIIFGFFDVQL